jgi:YidC/Oxa1 family membrane protein insertase
MQELQPKLSELQKKHGKDKQSLAREQMKLYKESGMNPAGCLLPMLVQMPVWIALYQAIIKVLAVTPENFLGLSQYLYSWPVLYSTLPLAHKFLWLDLTIPNLSMAVLVGGTMWIQQKMSMTAAADPKMQAQSRTMQWMMPLIFGYFCLNFPSGLSLYWLVSNIISIVMQYFVTGWGDLAGIIPGRAGKTPERDKKLKKRIEESAKKEATPVSADITAPGTAQEQEERIEDGESGDKREDSGGSHPTRLRAIRRQPRRSKHYRSKRR